MSIEQRLMKLENAVGNQRKPQFTIVLQPVELDETGRLFATGETQINIGCDDDILPFVAYDKPIPIL